MSHTQGIAALVAVSLVFIFLAHVIYGKGINGSFGRRFPYFIWSYICVGVAVILWVAALLY